MIGPAGFDGIGTALLGQAAEAVKRERGQATYQPPADMPYLSRSFPFLSIARHFDVSYANVLRVAGAYVDMLAVKPGYPLGDAIWYAAMRERNRKLGLLGPLEAGR